MTEISLRPTAVKTMRRLFAVQTASVEFCKTNTALPVTGQSQAGHIASVVTSDRPDCDGSKHPWLITASPGQRVNLTLYDFTIDPRYVTSTPNHGT